MDYLNQIVDSNFKEQESSYETSRKCLHLVDSTVSHNKKLLDENYRLRKYIHTMERKIVDLNETLFSYAYMKEVNKMFLLPYLIPFFHLTDTDKKNKCPICLEELMSLGNEAIVKTSCNHLFHGTCYYQNRASGEKPEECSCCRQNHLPFDIGFLNNKKEYISHTDSQIKKNLVKVLEIDVNHDLPSTEEILSQIYNRPIINYY